MSNEAIDNAMSDEAIDNAMSLAASAGPDNNIGPKITKTPDNNIGPKIVSPPGTVSVSKAKGSSFPIKLTVGNDNATKLNWTASVNVGWVKLSRSAGNDLAPNQSVTFDANVDVSSLKLGVQHFVLQTSFSSHMPNVPASITETTITVDVLP